MEAFLAVLDGGVGEIHEAGGYVAVEIYVWKIVFGELLDCTDHWQNNWHEIRGIGDE